jgi:Ethylbenzene dehydrogenase
MPTGLRVRLFAALAEPVVADSKENQDLPEEHLAMMKGSSSLLALALLPAATFAFPASAQDTVTATKADKAPNLAAGVADPAWAKAQALTVQLIGGRNFKDGKTTATMKAVYSGDMLYMLVQYDDPTESVRRGPYQKQPDGSWKKVSDPDDKGGDNNKFYEDKFGLIWNINNSIKGFSQQGCMVACHVGEAGKPFGNKYLTNEGELGDIWHLKSIRTGYIDQVDDQYLDHTRYDKDKAANAGRKNDPKTGTGGYTDIKLVNGKPEFMHKSGTPANKTGGTYYLKEEDKAPFDDSKFQPGDEVASILVAPFTGDRGDLATAIKWSGGKWTAVIARKLVTGSKFDVQFDNLDGTYEFGIAAFDNAQVRHAFHIGALKLKFAK